LYFPDPGEENAKAINCVRTEASKESRGMANPSRRGLHTEHGKRFLLYPDAFGFESDTGGGPLRFVAKDGEGIAVETAHGVSMLAGGSIRIEAPVIDIKSPERVSLYRAAGFEGGVPEGAVETRAGRTDVFSDGGRCTFTGTVEGIVTGAAGLAFKGVKAATRAGRLLLAAGREATEGAVWSGTDNLLRAGLSEEEFDAGEFGNSLLRGSVSGVIGGGAGRAPGLNALSKAIFKTKSPALNARLASGFRVAVGGAAGGGANLGAQLAEMALFDEEGRFDPDLGRADAKALDWTQLAISSAMGGVAARANVSPGNKVTPIDDGKRARVTGTGKESVADGDGIKKEFDGDSGYLGYMMSPEEAARYDEYWRTQGIGSDNTWNAFKKANPAATIDDYFTLIKEQSPWPMGENGNPAILKAGDRFFMAVENTAPDNSIGGFGIKERIPSVEFVRKNLAVKSNWKTTCNVIREFEVNDGVNLNVLEGPAGPQIDLSVDKYLPGDENITQYDLFSRLKTGINRLDYVHMVDEFWVD
jgi:hypothetical protein